MPNLEKTAQESKDRIRDELQGRVSVSTLEDVMSTIDYLEHQASTLAASGRAMNRLCTSHGLSIEKHFNEYAALHMEEAKRYAGDYLYESEREELLSEAAGAMAGGADGRFTISTKDDGDLMRNAFYLAGAFMDARDTDVDVAGAVSVTSTPDELLEFIDSVNGACAKETAEAISGIKAAGPGRFRICDVTEAFVRAFRVKSQDGTISFDTLSRLREFFLAAASALPNGRSWS